MRAASGSSRLPVPHPASTMVGRAGASGSSSSRSSQAIALTDSRLRSPRSVPSRILGDTRHGSQPGGSASQSIRAAPHGGTSVG
eukprot:scaffold111791_cov66-Phaeocystis_antarctica.AAC.2